MLLLATLAPCQAQEKLPVESDFYKITTFETPKDVVLEASSFQLMPNGKMAVASRRGEIWMIADPFAPEVKGEQMHRFAHGFHEVLSLAEKDGWLYLVQRTDVSRIKDTDGDGVADLFEVVNDEWEVSGDYHEYALMAQAEKMFVTGKAPYPVERTLLTSGLVQAGMQSLADGKKNETPHLAVRYEAPKESTFWRS